MKQKILWAAGAIVALLVVFPSFVGGTAGRLAGAYEVQKNKVLMEEYRRRNARTYSLNN